MSKYNQLFQEAKKEAENRIYGKCDHRDIIEYRDIQTVKHIGEILDSLEAKIEAANQWLPFDPENIPEAKEGWCFLIKDPAPFTLACFDWFNGKWVGYNCIEINPKEFKGKYYKLVPLT